MATLGFNEIVYILLVQLKGLTNGTDGITGIPSLSLGPLDFGQPRLYHLLVWGVALDHPAHRRSTSSDSRRGPRPAGPAPVGAGGRSSLGVDTSYRKVQVFVLSAVFASIAGSFDAYYVHVHQPRQLHHHLLGDPDDERGHRRAGERVGSGVGHVRHRDPARDAHASGVQPGLHQPGVRGAAHRDHDLPSRRQRRLATGGCGRAAAAGTLPRPGAAGRRASPVGRRRTGRRDVPFCSVERVSRRFGGPGGVAGRHLLPCTRARSRP